MRNIKLVIEYDGTNFVGWQSQINGRSVQDSIANVLEQILQEPITLIGAGRTDSGVHAHGQVANFHTQSTMSVGQMLSALNGLLPEEVYIVSAEELSEKFNARFDAKERCYRYFISLKPSAIGRQYHWFVKYDLSVDTMNKAAAMIIGEHDFESFCKYEAEVDHYMCNVAKSDWTKSADMLTYEVRANRFLHGMVRALVGTMVDIGRGYIPLSAFGEIMAAKDRRKAGMAVPASGLFLEEVLY
jgi:tRNA pseudouridine38-40 synthase